jgi:hypothetical protein
MIAAFFVMALVPSNFSIDLVFCAAMTAQGYAVLSISDPVQ